MITLAALVPTNLTSNTLTSAGLAVGLALLAVEHITWWRGGSGGAAAATGGKGKGKGAPAAAPAGKARDPQALVPFWSGVAFGTLMVACPAGLLGTAAGFLRWGGNGIGGLVMSWMTGTNASAIASAGAPALDQYGALVVTALVIVLWLLRKKVPKITKGRFKKGIFVGVLLAIGTGVFAYIGNAVIPGANEFGAWALNGLVHGTIGQFA